MLKKVKPGAKVDSPPEVGPRVLGIVWVPGEDPYFEGDTAFNLWEMRALLERATEIVEDFWSSAKEQEEADGD